MSRVAIKELWARDFGAERNARLDNIQKELRKRSIVACQDCGQLREAEHCKCPKCGRVECEA